MKMFKHVMISIFLVLLLAFSASAATVSIWKPEGTVTEEPVKFRFNVDDKSGLNECQLWMDYTVCDGSDCPPTEWQNVASVPAEDITAGSWYNEIVLDTITDDYTFNWNIVCVYGHTTVTDSENKTIITDINHAPVLDAIVVAPLTEGTAESDATIVTATDVDEDTLTFSVTSKNESRAVCSIGASDGVLAITPTGDYFGDAECEVKVTDTREAYDNETVTFTIENVNDAPVLDAIASQTAVVGDKFSYDVNATDVDEGDVLTYFTEDSLISIDSATGVISFTPTSEDVGSHSVTVGVLDSEEQDTETFTLTVREKQASLGWTVQNGKLLLEDDLSAVKQRVPIKLNITNTGEIDFNDVSLEIGEFKQGSTVFDSDFTVSPKMTGNSIANGDSLELEIQFNSADNNTALGTYTGEVNVTYNGDQRLTRSDVSIEVSKVNYALTVPSSLRLTQGKRNDTVSTSFDIKNTGNADLTGIVISHDIDSKYGITLSPVSVGTLASGATQAVTIGATIPSDQAFGVEPIGTITVTSAQKTHNFTVKMDTQGMLVIEDLDVKVDGNSDKNLENGDTISEDAKPGSEVKFKFKIKNMIDEDADEDKIENIFVTVDIDGVEDTEESEEIELDGEESDTLEVVFDSIDSDIDEGDYDVKITLEGEDEDGTVHEVEWDLVLTIDKEKHEITIKRATISPETVTCGGSTVLSVTLENTGANDEDVDLSIRESILGISASRPEFELDESDDAKKSFTIDIPEDAAKGTYTIAVSAEYGSKEATDDVVLTVVECSDDLDDYYDEEDEEEGIDLMIGQDGGLDLTSTGGPATTIRDSTSLSFIDSPGYLILLVLVNIALIGVGIGLLVKFLVK